MSLVIGINISHTPSIIACIKFANPVGVSIYPSILFPDNDLPSNYFPLRFIPLKLAIRLHSGDAGMENRNMLIPLP